SGPYKIAEVKPGHTISYELRDDYWGKDLPTTAGLYNFKTIRYDYYRDDKVALEAFKAGEADVRGERNPSLWKTGYDCPAVKRGDIIREEFEIKSPQGMFAFVFNTRRPLFADIRVREALNLVFDFESFNRIVLHNEAKRTQSFFTGTELAASGEPQGQELDILKSFKDKLPAEVFANASPVAAPSPKELRTNIQKAQHLLSEAGWELKSGTLIHKTSKQKFEFELLLSRPEDEKTALYFARNLKPLGMTVNIRVLDSAQYLARTSTFDFDMMVWTWGGTRSPGQEQRYYWGSKAADEQGSRNYPGIKDPIVDQLTEKMTSAKDRAGLEAAARALDRVLRAGKYVVPLYHINKNRLAYRRDFRHPEMKDYVPILLSTWWYQPNKEK
ncbi:MAG: extracellular solute-binding protein, partial [Holosporales bacterium]